MCICICNIIIIEHLLPDKHTESSILLCECQSKRHVVHLNCLEKNLKGSVITHCGYCHNATKIIRVDKPVLEVHCMKHM